MRVHNRGFKRGAGRWLADFGLALTLFWIAVFALNGNHSRALAVPLPTLGMLLPAQHTHTTAPTDRRAVSLHRQIREVREARAAHTRTLVLLSITFAALAALNLAFWRHLRRVYASPRRGVWRRG